MLVQVFSPAYHADNICGAVHFQTAIEALPAGTVCIELGPDCGLLAQVRRLLVLAVVGCVRFVKELERA